MRPYKRRKFFIDKQFQLKYILLVIFMLLLYTIFFVVTLFLPQLLPFIFNSPITEQARAAEILLLYHKNVWPAVFIVIPLFGFFSIFITHKIAGPVYRLKQKLEQMAVWNLNTTLKLRTGDDLQDLAECVNLLSEELKDFVNDMQSSFDAISENIVKVEAKIASKDIDESKGKETILMLEDCRKRLERTISRFRPDQDPAT